MVVAKWGVCWWRELTMSKAKQKGNEMKVVYLAHPVSGDVAGNIAKAKKWVRWIEEKFTGIAVVASWITECEIWDDDNPAHRAAGFERDLAVLDRCDELWLVGPRVSKGMQYERAFADKRLLRVRDFTSLGLELPPGMGVAERQIEELTAI